MGRHLVIIALTFGACAESRVAPDAPETPRDAAPDAAELDAPVAMDVPLLPIDAPRAEAHDAPVPDAPWEVDAGPCVPGTWRLEGTPRAFAPVALEGPSADGWIEAIADGSGRLVWQHVSDDLESITWGAPLPDLPIVRDGITYEPERLVAVSPARGEVLVVVRPVATYVDHVLAVSYARGGSRVHGPARIDLGGDLFLAAAASTATGWSLFFTVREIELGVPTPPARVVDLASTLTPAPARDAPRELQRAILARDGASWVGLAAGYGATGDAQWRLGDDGTVSVGPALSSASLAITGAARSSRGVGFWITTTWWFAGGPTFLRSFTSDGAIADDVMIDESGPSYAVLDVVDAETAGVLLLPPTGGPPTFIEVRDGTVTQRLALPGSSSGPALLRFLGDRWAIGWGGTWLDELVRCE